jgi:ABC-2 type transport system permease protein
MLLVVFGVVFTTGTEADYLPTAVDLLLPMELLIPALAIALGYRTIASDDQRGELDVLKTYPLPTWGYVLGVYVGRAIALAVIVGVPLLLVGLYVSMQPSEESIRLAIHQGVDSPLVFGRFLVLTLAFGFVVLAMALAASALARSRRTALVVGIAVLVFVVIGLDLLISRGFVSGWIASNQLTSALAFSPTSAYRGLVFETVISTATETQVQQASITLSLLGLGVWGIGSLLIATVSVSRSSLF